MGPPQVTSSPGAADCHCFFDLGNKSLVLAALKRSQDHPQRFILRLYEVDTHDYYCWIRSSQR
jgi:alpha-mannosidase